MTDKLKALNVPKQKRMFVKSIFNVLHLTGPFHEAIRCGTSC